jgi:ribulose-5-phosphate 4-epimerase/fuculose-1-phosphate aldolase
MVELDKLREQVLFGARVLPRYVGDVFGHVTARLPESYGREGFVMKHLRIPRKGIDPDEVMIFDLDGNILEGSQDRPYEVALYTNVFKHRRDVNSVVHCHPLYSLAVGMAGKTVFPIHQSSQRFRGPVPVMRGNLVTDDVIGGELVNALGTDGIAVLQKGHGVVAVGADVPDAVVSCIYLEDAAKIQIWAAAVGTPEMLPQELIDENQKGNFLWRYLEWQEEESREAAAVLR